MEVPDPSPRSGRGVAGFGPTQRNIPVSRAQVMRRGLTVVAPDTHLRLKLGDVAIACAMKRHCRYPEVFPPTHATAAGGDGKR